MWRGRDEGIEVTLCTYGVSFYQSYGSGLRVRTKPDPYHLAVWIGRDEGIGVLLCTYGFSFYQSYGSGLRVRTKPDLSTCCGER